MVMARSSLWSLGSVALLPLGFKTTYLTTSSGLLPVLLDLTSPKTGVSILPSYLPQAHCSWFLGPCCGSPDPLPVSLHCAQS